MTKCWWSFAIKEARQDVDLQDLVVAKVGFVMAEHNSLKVWTTCLSDSSFALLHRKACLAHVWCVWSGRDGPRCFGGIVFVCFCLAPSILTFLCRFVEMICNQKSGTFFQATPLVVEIGRAYESQRYEYIRQLQEEEERQIMESQQHAS